MNKNKKQKHGLKSSHYPTHMHTERGLSSKGVGSTQIKIAKKENKKLS